MPKQPTNQEQKRRLEEARVKAEERSDAPFLGHTSTVG